MPIDQECPAILQDERLEDAFITPVTDENGECEPLPAIYNDYVYGMGDDEVLILSLKSASMESNLYSKSLDDKALVWDSVRKRLLLYIPDPDAPQVAFKGSAWQYAKRLKPEYEEYISLRDVYYEYLENNKD